jgi:hypothetical protein
MKQFSKLMLIALSFGISAVALSLLPSKPVGAAGSAPVTVTNTPLPVSLTGTGSISGNVSAAQSGAWNVGINGTPSVNVAGLPLSVSISGSPTITLPTHLGIQPSSMVALTCAVVQGDGCAEFAQVAPDGSVTNPFSIPAGMDLVITEVSWFAFGGVSGKTARFIILADSGYAFHRSAAQINADGFGGANETYTTGFRVSTMPTFFVSTPLDFLDVRGYLVPHQ